MFDDAVPLILKHEGGLVDDPADPGGVTNRGISIRFAGSIGLDIDEDGDTDADDIRALTAADATAIYREHFWDRCRCDELPAPLALCVFDCAVNQGTGAAARLLQESVGAAVDGIVGPNTVRAVGNADPARALHEFTARRAQHYATTRNVERFGLGWYRRMLDVYARALGMT